MATNESLSRTILIVIAVVLLLPVLMMVFMMPMMGLWGWGHMWNGGMWGGTGSTWLWLLTMLVPLLVILGAGYFLSRTLRHRDEQRTDPAVEELRSAYARGELSDEEFQERRERLQRDR